MHHRLGDYDYSMDAEHDSFAQAKEVVPTAPILRGPPTAAKTLPYLTHVRTVTTSLVTSLTSISEHAQVNGINLNGFDRKIKALKNKFVDLRTEWDSAERSREKIEHWEAGIVDGAAGDSTPGKRIDARRLAEDHLRAFEAAIAEANLKTKAIMAPS